MLSRTHLIAWGHIVSVRRTRLNVFVLLTLLALLLAGESPTCILHEDVHTPRNTRDPSITHTQLAKLSFDKKSFLVDLPAEAYSFHF